MYIFISAPHRTFIHINSGPPIKQPILTNNPKGVCFIIVC